MKLKDGLAAPVLQAEMFTALHGLTGCGHVRLCPRDGWGLLHGLLVVHVFTQASPNPLQVGDVVRDLLDGLHLLLQVLALKEVAHLWEKGRC